MTTFELYAAVALIVIAGCLLLIAAFVAVMIVLFCECTASLRAVARYGEGASK